MEGTVGGYRGRRGHVKRRARPRGSGPSIGVVRAPGATWLRVLSPVEHRWQSIRLSRVPRAAGRRVAWIAPQSGDGWDGGAAEVHSPQGTCTVHCAGTVTTRERRRFASDGGPIVRDLPRGQCRCRADNAGLTPRGSRSQHTEPLLALGLLREDATPLRTGLCVMQKCDARSGNGGSTRGWLPSAGYRTTLLRGGNGARSASDDRLAERGELADRAVAATGWSSAAGRLNGHRTARRWRTPAVLGATSSTWKMVADSSAKPRQLQAPGPLSRGITFSGGIE